MNREDLINQFREFDIPFDDRKVDLLFSYMNYTLETNEKFNLTAITNRDEFVEKMILDSALVLNDNDLQNKTVIDIGTGAGYPGMVLKILQPNARFTLLDSTNKKVDFIKEFALANNLQIDPVVDRAESYSRKHVEQYDIAMARAVAHLSILMEIIAPLLKVNGYFIALKGLNYEEEINESANAFKKLGLAIADIQEFELPECHEKRALIRIKKIKPTNKKYPRDYSEIKKQPL